MRKIVSREQEYRPCRSDYASHKERKHLAFFFTVEIFHDIRIRYIYSPPPPTKVEIFILLVVVIVEATLFESGEKNIESHRARLRLNPRSVTWYKLYARFTRLTRKGK